MDLYSYNLELRAIRSLTDNAASPQKRMVLLSKLSEGHFSVDITRESYTRIRKVAASGSELPDWEDLLSDPRLSDEIKDALSDETTSASSVPPAKYKKLMAALTKYKVRRDLKTVAESIVKGLGRDESEEFDESMLRTQVAEQLAQVGVHGTTDMKFYGMGAGARGSALKLARATLDSPKEPMYKTGISDYDDKNGGLPASGVVLLAGTTSSGKSTVSMNLAIDMALLNGIRVDRITLEMTREAEIKRTMSMISGVEFNKIKQGTLTPAEKKRILKAMEEHDAELEKAGGSYNFISPPSGMSMDDVLHLADATGAQVSIIDYVGLLNDISTDNQAANLSEAVRKAKIHANNTGRLYILLVQLDSDSGKIRYSRGMQEHCDVALTWSYVDMEVRALKALPITVAKARDGELFEFEVPEEYGVMAIGRRALLHRQRVGRSARADLGDHKERSSNTSSSSGASSGAKYQRKDRPKRDKPRGGSFESELGGKSYV